MRASRKPLIVVLTAMLAPLSAPVARAQARPQAADTLRLVTPAGHTAPVVAAAFSDDSRFLISASRDGSARVWDVESGREVRQLWHSGPPPIAAGFVSRDEASTATVSATYHWDLHSGA